MSKKVTMMNKGMLRIAPEVYIDKERVMVISSMENLIFKKELFSYLEKEQIADYSESDKQLSLILCCVGEKELIYISSLTVDKIAEYYGKESLLKVSTDIYIPKESVFAIASCQTRYEKKRINADMANRNYRSLVDNKKQRTAIHQITPLGEYVYLSGITTETLKKNISDSVGE